MKGLMVNFNFIVVLNLLVLLIWPVSTPYINDRRGAIGIIVYILTVLALLFDIIFLVISFVT